MNDKIIIISPHSDDALIGNYEIITYSEIKEINIIYTENELQERREESLKLREYIKDKKINQLFNKDIPTFYLDKKYTFYFPDPIHEIHPAHRKQGYIGEQLLKDGFNIIFYSIIMNVPWIHEIQNSTEKEELLNKVHPSCKALWEWDKKYILFEGRYKWLN